MKNKYELIDFIFYVIRINDEISATAITEKYHGELLKLACDQHKLERILSELIKDNKIYEADGTYRVAPHASQFTGYYFETLGIQKTTSRKAKWEMVFKLLPIAGTFIFGVLTFYLNYTNRVKDKKIEQEEARLKIQNGQIDSLEKLVNKGTTASSKPKE
ncbi:MAG TPA: hypothetical protein VLJ68_08040 [Chitinophagaceae bacterium]|nr:hypothetical protein [Chitinophagaceae bacterium]